MDKNRLAKTPPMGWNSWDCYGAAVNEEQLLGNAEYMAKYLKDYGWQYVVCDIQWYEPKAKDNDYNNFKNANAVLIDNITVNSGVVSAESTDVRVWDPIAYAETYNNSSAAFHGKFDGQGHTVSNFKITRAICVAEYADDVALGLFGYADSAYIVNLGVTDLLIQVDAWCEISVGGLVGYAENVNITNCYTSGTIAVSSNVAADVGGQHGDVLELVHIGFKGVGTQHHKVSQHAGADHALQVFVKGSMGAFHSVGAECFLNGHPCQSSLQTGGEHSQSFCPFFLV